jgi:hypothetical protein
LKVKLRLNRVWQGGKLRQVPAIKGGKSLGAEAINSSQFVIAFYRFLSLQFRTIFPRTISLGDGVSKKLRLSSFRKPLQITFD